jgi:Holliday junction resolvase RusA-like endonuclease
MKFVVDLKLDNWNTIINRNRYNRYSANSYKKAEMKEISKFLENIPKIDKYPIKIVFKWHVKRLNCDLDNKSVKSLLDCMQNVGILENDDIKHIKEITHIAIKDDKEFVEVEII